MNLYSFQKYYKKPSTVKLRAQNFVQPSFYAVVGAKAETLPFYGFDLLE